MIDCSYYCSFSVIIFTTILICSLVGHIQAHCQKISEKMLKMCIEMQSKLLDRSEVVLLLLLRLFERVMTQKLEGVAERNLRPCC